MARRKSGNLGLLVGGLLGGLVLYGAHHAPQRRPGITINDEEGRSIDSNLLATDFLHSVRNVREMNTFYTPTIKKIKFDRGSLTYTFTEHMNRERKFDGLPDAVKIERGEDVLYDSEMPRQVIKDYAQMSGHPTRGWYVPMKVLDIKLPDNHIEKYGGELYRSVLEL